jgi:predicted nucleotidyltransferase
MSEPAVAIDRDKIAEFCRRNHIEWLSLFGSILRDDFGPESDVDVLVEFEEGHTPGLDFFSMQAELSEIIGRRVDLNTPGCLSKYFRDQVLSEARELYAKAH